MLFKMLGIERAYAQKAGAGLAVVKPRQIFVTQSRVLATRVEEYFAKLRGDEQAMRQAAVGANGGEVDHRKEQDGY